MTSKWGTPAVTKIAQPSAGQRARNRVRSPLTATRREVNLTPALKSRPNKVIAKAGVRPFVLREHRFTRSMEMNERPSQPDPSVGVRADRRRQPLRRQRGARARPRGESPPPVHKHAALGETDADKYDHKDPSHRVIAGIGPVMPEVQHKLCPDRSANRADKHCASAGGGHRQRLHQQQTGRGGGPPRASMVLLRVHRL